jgi:hypothetical protein
MFHLANIDDKPVFIKCAPQECDFYYVEILAGRLYVGYLYTVIDKEALKNKKNAPEWKEYK